MFKARMTARIGCDTTTEQLMKDRQHLPLLPCRNLRTIPHQNPSDVVLHLLFVVGEVGDEAVKAEHFGNISQKHLYLIFTILKTTRKK